jgi:hypothetical protein
MVRPSLSGPVVLYLPQRGQGAKAYRVLQGSDRVGAYDTRLESLQFALRLAKSIHHYHHVAVSLRIEDESGEWETVEAHAAS